MRISDHLAEEELGSVAFATHGQSLAFTRQRPASSQRHNGLVIPQVLSDVWVQETPGAPAKNITNGQTDASGWWAPRWSPDGQRLAVLSSRGGEVTPWVWERATQRLRQISTSGIDFDEDYGSCHWADARHLVCLGLPEGERATPMGRDGNHVGKGVEQAEAAWAKAKHGELSVSAVSSLEFRFPEARILSIDAAIGTTAFPSERVVAKTRRDFGSNNWSLSPSGQVVAAVKPGSAVMSYFVLDKTGFPASVDLQRLDGQAIKFERLLPANIVTTSMQWSPDGRELAFFALEDKMIHAQVLYGDNAREVRYRGGSSKDYPGILWRANVVNGRLEQWRTGDLDLGQGAAPPEFQWTSGGELLFQAPLLVNGMRRVNDSGESQWVVLGRNGRTRSLLSGSEELQSIAGGRRFVWLAEGDVLSVDPATGTVRNLTAGFALPVVHFETESSVLILYTNKPRTQTEQILLNAGRVGSFAQPYFLEIGSGGTPSKATLLPKPVPEAKLAGLSAGIGGDSPHAAYMLDDRTGTFLWRSSAKGNAEQITAANTFRQQILFPEQRLIEYTTLNGERMAAKLILPYGYRKERRVPLVVDSDIGYTPQSATSFNIDPAVPLPYGERYWDAMGYAYMFTSMPTRRGMDETGRANLLMGPGGVIPAVDELIRQGIADPDRVFLFGESSMGYGVYALVTQTSRFKAAVAASGWVDQITNSLSLTVMDRYSDNPFYYKAAFGARYTDLRLPFWRNADHLRRNSPLSYVDRVQTPLMIIKGDMDVVGGGLSDDEMFFSALVQQHKPAEFVRYFGEGHGIFTPANIRDMWQRIFAWYDQWGDVARDETGHILYDEKDRVKSRAGAPPLTPEDFAKFALFAPGDDATTGL